MTDIHNTLQSGIDAIRRGDKEAAREAFRSVLKEDPDNTQALLWLAGVANTRDEKQRVLERVIELDPDNTLAQTGLDRLDVAPQTDAPTSDLPTTDDPGDETALSKRRRRRVEIASAGAAAASAVPLQPETVPADHEDEETDDVRRRRSLLWLFALPLCLAVIGVGAWYLAQRGFDPWGMGQTAAVATETATPGDQAMDATETPPPASEQGSGGDVVAGAEMTGTTTLAIPNVVVNSNDDPAAEVEAIAEPAPAPTETPGNDAPAPSPIASPEPAPAAPAPTTAAVGATGTQLLGVDQTLQTGQWEWSYFGLSNYTTGSGYSVQPANGRYLIVLMLVRNTGNASAQIPDGLFVVTDAQGRSISFNRPISVEYMRRYGVGVGGDYPANANIPVTNTPVSVPLLFDVAPDATDLIVTSATDPSRGFLVRSDLRSN